jgi:hypothetical protein
MGWFPPTRNFVANFANANTVLCVCKSKAQNAPRKCEHFGKASLGTLTFGRQSRHSFFVSEHGLEGDAVDIVESQNLHFRIRSGVIFTSPSA